MREGRENEWAGVCVVLGLCLAGCAAIPGNTSPGIERQLAFATAFDLDDPDTVLVTVPAPAARPDRTAVLAQLVDALSTFYACAIVSEQDYGNPVDDGIVSVDFRVGTDGAVTELRAIAASYTDPETPRACALAAIEGRHFGAGASAFSVQAAFATGQPQLEIVPMALTLPLRRGRSAFSADDLWARVRADAAVSGCLRDVSPDALLAFDLALEDVRVKRVDFLAAGGSLAVPRGAVECLVDALGELEVTALDARSHALVIAVDRSLRGVDPVEDTLVFDPDELALALASVREERLADDLRMTLLAPSDRSCVVWDRFGTIEVRLTPTGRYRGGNSELGFCLMTSGPVVRAPGVPVDLDLTLYPAETAPSSAP